MSNEANQQDGGSGTMSGSRLAEFEAEVANLSLRGGGANKEKTGSGWGVGIAIVGAIVAVFAYLSAIDSASGSAGLNPRLEFLVLSTLGIVIATVGIVIWIRNSMTRYLRYWIIRLVYEQREQTDRLIEAIERTNR